MEDPRCLRIVDANANRAREALRVMEDFARFVLDDAALCGMLKALRHRLREALSIFALRGMTALREIVTDVGKDVRTKSEYSRASAVGVAVAAGKRLSEALRCIEEYGKVIDPQIGLAVEKLRYTGYEIEQRLMLHAQANDRFGAVRLYGILTESLCQLDWRSTAEALVRGGVDCLQLREKELKDRELLERSRVLAELCAANDVLFVVNDRPDIAVLSGATGVHVGQDDLTVSQARRMVGPDRIVGVSTHTLQQFENALHESPTYLAVGPLFDSGTKPQDHIAGAQTLRMARERTSLPIVAIGGIDERNVAEVLAAANCGICVCSAIICQPDPQERTERLVRAIDAVASVNRTM